MTFALCVATMRRLPQLPEPQPQPEPTKSYRTEQVIRRNVEGKEFRVLAITCSVPIVKQIAGLAPYSTDRCFGQQPAGHPVRRAVQRAERVRLLVRYGVGYCGGSARAPATWCLCAFHSRACTLPRQSQVRCAPGASFSNATSRTRTRASFGRAVLITSPDVLAGYGNGGVYRRGAWSELGT